MSLAPLACLYSFLTNAPGSDPFLIAGQAALSAVGAGLLGDPLPLRLQLTNLNTQLVNAFGGRSEPRLLKVLNLMRFHVLSALNEFCCPSQSLTMVRRASLLCLDDQSRGLCAVCSVLLCSVPHCFMPFTLPSPSPVFQELVHALRHDELDGNDAVVQNRQARLPAHPYVYPVIAQPCSVGVTRL